MSRSLRLPFLFFAALAAGASQAHFMWATVSPRGRTPIVRLQFAESPEEGLVKEFSGKGGAVKAVAPMGQALPLQAQGDLLLGEISADTTSVGANLDYGVIDRGGEFMLIYHAKASTTPEASQTSLNLPLEMFAAAEADGSISVRVLRDGKPSAGAEVVAALPGLREPFKGKTDGEGRVGLPKALGLGGLSIRAGVAETVDGTFEGKTYHALRRYTTLTLNSLGTAEPKADPIAFAALEKAWNARATTYPANAASISGNLAVRTPEGKTIRSEFETGNPLYIEADGWPRTETIAATETLERLFARPIADFARGPGRNPLTADENGRILLHDRANTTYVVRGDEIVEIATTLGELRQVTTIVENTRTPDGKTLPHRYEVKTLDAKGKPIRTVTYIDEYQSMGGAWLPKSRCATTVENGKTTVRETRFDGLKINLREEG